MQIADASFIEGTTEHILVIRKLHSMSCQYVAGTAYTGAASVSVLGNLVAGSSNNKGRTGADVKGVLAVASCTNYIQCIVIV